MLQPVGACHGEAPDRPVSATLGISGTNDFFPSQPAKIHFANLFLFEGGILPCGDCVHMARTAVEWQSCSG